MEQETPNQITEEQVQANVMFKVTPFSKYLALALFVALPFIGGWIGYNYAPEKVVEVERVVYKETPVNSNAVEDQLSQSAEEVVMPSISVLGYENSEPLLSIKVSYENLPANSSALALCLSDGGCTEWVDTFTPSGQVGVHSMTTTKNLVEGEYIIVVIGDEFSDKIVASEPFVIDLESEWYADEVSGIVFQHPNTWDCSTRNHTVDGQDSPYIQCKEEGEITLDMYRTDFSDSQYKRTFTQVVDKNIGDYHEREIRVNTDAGMGSDGVILYSFIFGNETYEVSVPFDTANGWTHDYYETQEQALSVVDAVVTSIF